MTTVDDLCSVVAPGESCSYSDLLERLHRAEREPRGVSLLLESEAPDRRGSGNEFIVWMRDRFWDAEVVGGWSEEDLWIARRPARPT